MVVEHFNDVEAIKVAQNLEKNGFTFYTIAADQAQSEDVKKVFQRLAADEEQHYTDFYTIGEELKKVSGSDEYYDDPEITGYLNNIVKSGIFAMHGGAENVAAGIKSEMDAIKLAIQVEKDAIIFFSEMKSNCRSESGKRAFTRFVGEERKHLRILMERMESLQM